MNVERFCLRTDVPRLLFCTGAGLSAESGITTFRDADGEGMWDEYDLNEVCNIATFDRNYNKVHRFYNQRRIALANVEPNAAHKFIAEMQELYGDDRVMHITANVDDLAERAGGTAMHVHGNIKEIIDPFVWEGYEVKDVGYTEFIPSNDSKYRAKPAVVMFGEYYRYENGRRKPVYEDRDKVLSTLNETDTVIVIGSSDLVIMWSYLVGDNTPATTMNVNPEEHDNDSSFHQNIYLPATQAIDDMLELIQGRM